MESGQDFAARHWGGEGITPVAVPASKGPRDIDGGRVSYPAGWTFTADGATYKVWQTKDDTWHMAVGYDGFATWRRDGSDWVVDYGWSNEVKRVPARDGEAT